MATQPVEADMPVAFQAGVGRVAAAVSLDEEVDDFAAEDLARVQHVEGNVEAVGDAARIRHLARRAAAVVNATVHGGLGPEAHHHADNFVALALQEGRGHGTVHTAAEGDNDAGGLRRAHRGTRSRRSLVTASASTDTARSISASVVARPTVRRKPPVAAGALYPMASSTAEGSGRPV